MFETFSYLVYVLFFPLLATGISWLVAFRFLSRNWKVIFSMGLLGIGYQFIVNPIAEAWRTWHFSQDRILGIWIGNFPIENTLFFFLVAIAISSATLMFIYLGRKA